MSNRLGDTGRESHAPKRIPQNVLTVSRKVDECKPLVVGRFNFFVTAGYEKSCGTRTDLWFLNQLKRRGCGHSCPDCLLIMHLCTLAGPGHS
jgi:hypothetical protein